MKTLKELRAERAALVKKSRNFLETRATDDVRLSAEDDATYAKMEEDLSSYDRQIERLENLDRREAQMEKPTSTPLTSTPESPKMDVRTGTASDEYRNAFWIY